MSHRSWPVLAMRDQAAIDRVFWPLIEDLAQFTAKLTRTHNERLQLDQELLRAVETVWVGHGIPCSARCAAATCHPTSRQRKQTMHHRFHSGPRKWLPQLTQRRICCGWFGRCGKLGTFVIVQSK
jgi:hypothetical protein